MTDKENRVKINLNSSLSIGRQLKEYILKKIKNRELLPGDKLPSLRKLHHDTGISLGIIRQAINDLSGEGWLRMHQGLGVFVAEPLSGPKKIALVLPCIGPEHITHIIKGVKEGLSQVNASLVLYAADDYNEETDIVNMLDCSYVAGAIIYPPPTQSFENALKELNSRKVPIVLVDTLIKTNKIPAVTVNHRKMGYESMKHLLQNNHRNIGLIGIDSRVYSYQELLGGFRDATLEYGVDFEKLPKVMGNPMHIEPDNPWQTGMHEVMSFIETNPNITAIIGYNENITMGAVLGLKKMGKRIPEDISIISLGALDCFKVTTPTISCVNQPYDEIGKLAGIHMLQILCSNVSVNPVTMHLDPILECRQSVARLPTP